MSPGRCDWCGRPLPLGMRRDAKFCSQSCRQASHRFRRAVVLDGVGDASGAVASSGRRMRFAYADPPYPGNARRYYGSHRDFAGEVDHEALLEALDDGYPDGWALSTSADALPTLLGMASRRARRRPLRVCAWFRGERPSSSRAPLSAWEPVLVAGGRRRLCSIEERRVDALVWHARPRLTDPERVPGAKPARFCRWVFELLGAEPGDELVDLFPGSGGIGRAWALYASSDGMGEEPDDAAAV